MGYYAMQVNSGIIAILINLFNVLIHLLNINFNLLLVLNYFINFKFYRLFYCYFLYIYMNELFKIYEKYLENKSINVKKSKKYIF